MTTYALNRVIRSTCNYSLANGGLGQTVMHFAALAGAAVQDDVDAAASAWNEFWTHAWVTVALKSYMSSECVIVSADARTVDPANPLESHFAIGAAGTGGAQSLPLETSAVVSYYTELANRRGRGRIFVPGLTKDQLTDGRFTEAGRANFQANVEAWNVGGVYLTRCVPIVFSRINTNGHDITGVAVRSVFHHQRRRNA